LLSLSAANGVLMFISADQLLAHAIGDYLLQSDWMAAEKAKHANAALCHALCYTLPFIFLRPSLLGLVFIVSTHYVIDRHRLPKYLIRVKNRTGPPRT